MAKEKKSVIFAPKDKISIRNIGEYITERGYPKRAEKFVNNLYSFGESLAIMPEKFNICRQPKLARKKMRCVAFRKNYIFVHKVEKNNVIIYNVIHGKTDPGSIFRYYLFDSICPFDHDEILGIRNYLLKTQIENFAWFLNSVAIHVIQCLISRILPAP